MWAFLQANSNWIIAVVFVGFMLWMHLGMGHGSHGGHAAHGDQPQTTPPADDAPARPTTSNAARAATPQESSSKHGCH